MTTVATCDIFANSSQKRFPPAVPPALLVSHHTRRYGLQPSRWWVHFPMLTRYPQIRKTAKLPPYPHFGQIASKKMYFLFFPPVRRVWGSIWKKPERRKSKRFSGTTYFFFGMSLPKKTGTPGGNGGNVCKYLYAPFRGETQAFCCPSNVFWSVVLVSHFVWRDGVPRRRKTFAASSFFLFEISRISGFPVSRNCKMWDFKFHRPICFA